MYTRALAWFSIAAQVVFVGAWITLGALEDGYSHLDHHVSELGAEGAANPNWMNAAIVVYGLSFIAIAVALRALLPRRRAAQVAVALFLLAGIAIVIAGPLNADCSTALDASCQKRWDDWDVDTGAKIHGWSSLIAQILVLPTPFALARALWNRPVAAPVLAAGVFGLGLAILISVLFRVDDAPDGLTQRIGLLALHVWVILIALGILWATRRGPALPPSTPIRPREFFDSSWSGEGELVPWPYFLWRRFPQRIKVRRDATFLSDEDWYFDDRAWLADGTLVEERRVYCSLVAPDRVRVISQRLLGQTEILLEETGYRIVPYRVAMPVGPLHFGVTVHDSASVRDGTLVNRLRLSWFGLPVARVELRARPESATRSRPSS